MAAAEAKPTMRPPSPITLTTHNPFGDDDAAGQGGYALVSSLLSKVKSTFAAPVPGPTSPVSANESAIKPKPKPAPIPTSQTSVRAPSLRPATKSLRPVGSNPAPPLVSFAPIAVEQPRFVAEGAYPSPQTYDAVEGTYGTSIPGFAIPDDARSVRTVASTKRGVSASKVIRRLRGLSREYWMDDEHCKECYDCKSVFTTWRRKHHCRVCGQIFCSRCAANIISSSRFGQDGMIRVCNLCLQVLEDEGLDDDDDKRSVTSAATSAPHYHPFQHHHSQSLSQSYPHHSHSHSFSQGTPQSPLAQFTSRQTDEPFSLFSIGDFSLRRRLHGHHDSDDSRPQTPTELFADSPFSPDLRAPAPFRRAAGDDDLSIGGTDAEAAGTEEKDLEMYLGKVGADAHTSPALGRRVNVGGKGFVFPKLSKPDTSGALQLETGAPTLSASPDPMSTDGTPTPSNPPATATLTAPTTNAESTIQFPASASSPETPVSVSVSSVPMGIRSERPRLGSGERLRLDSYDRPRLSSFGAGRLDSFGGGAGRLDSFSGGRLDSFSGSYTGGGDRTPFLRSRVHSRLGEFSPVSGSGEGEAGWRTRRESSAYAAELNAVSMFHLRIMVRQLLARAQIGRGVKDKDKGGDKGDGDQEGNGKPGNNAAAAKESEGATEWEDTLLRLSLKLASRLNVASSSSGTNADMDVRHFVKIKKIPGGRPRDSEYVDGAVISSNLAHKKMKRHLHSPRIMILAFSLEWQRRENEYLTLDSILSQEREYLRNLVARITALRPHLVLVERTVSRLALDYLMEANIAVARAVPPRSTKFVARMTGAEVVPDIPALHRGPRLGECSRFRVQTYEHHLIPGRRKTFMRFEGCDTHRSGCTLILRGADLETLRRVKEVMRFIAFIVRNLKMESFLWKDCVVTMPGVTGDAVPTPNLGLGSSMVGVAPSEAGLMRPRAKSFPTLGARVVSSDASGGGGLAKWVPPALPEPSPVFDDDSSEEDEEGEDAALSRRIEASLRPYLTTFISASATLRFLPPWPIRKMKEADDRMRGLKREWEEQERERERAKQVEREKEWTKQIEREKEKDQEREQGDEADRGESEASASNTPSVVVVAPTEEPPAKTLHPSPSISSLRSVQSNSGTHPATVPVPPSRVPTPAPTHTPTSGIVARPPPALHTASELELEAKLADAQFQHEELRRIWEWYLRKNRDDFAVEKYQQIFLRFYMIPTAQVTTSSNATPSSSIGQLDNPHRPCFRPELVHKSYYGQNDQSLAQFIEEACSIPANAVCTGKGCNVLRISHTQVYVHNESRVLIATEPWTGRIGANRFAAPLYDSITTWSLCRVCMQNTPLIPLSEEAGRYSFVKFLELHFYPADVLLMHGAGCSHNIYQHHVRYFHLRGMTVHFQTEKVTLHELVFPPTRVRVRPQALLGFKNSDYLHMLHRNTAYWDSVLTRVQVALDAAAQMAQIHQEQAQIIAALAGDMRERSLLRRAEVEQLIHQAYTDSSVTDTLQLGRVRPIWQGIITQFDDDFGRLEKLYLPTGLYAGTEKDFRRSVAQNKIAKYVPGIEIMGNMFNTMDRKVMSRFVDSERRPTVLRKEVEQPASSASEYDSNVDSSAEPPTSETDARPSSIDLPSPAESGGYQLHEPPIAADDIPVEQLSVDGNLGEMKRRDSHEDSEGGESDSTIPAPQARPEAVLEDTGVHSETEDTHPHSAANIAPLELTIDTDSISTTTGRAHAEILQTESPVAGLEDIEATKAAPPLHDPRKSRLPRRARVHPSVADLVKQFQAVLPENFASGAVAYGPLARTSLLSDSERESESQSGRGRGRPKAPANRSKFQPKPLNQLGSDFERSYASNVAPRQTREYTGDGGPSRIPGPVQPVISPPTELPHSGRSSPTHSTLYIPKRPGLSRTTTGSTIKNIPVATALGSSPPAGRKVPSPLASRPVKGKAPAKNPPRDRSTARTASATGPSRQGTRRVTVPSGGLTGSKVASHVRQFERISKEHEKANRRYAIMRGRRARPVAYAKPKVEIFNNFKDALRDDDEESSDSSSEADDEDEGEGEEETMKLRADTLESILSVPDLDAHPDSIDAPQSNLPEQETQQTTSHEADAQGKHQDAKDSILPGQHLNLNTPESSLPPSPFIRPMHEHQLGQANYSENETSTSVDRRSFLHRVSSAAMSRIQSRESTIMNLAYPAAPTDHVFAESYITVREDEPTSIIALTLSAHDYQINMAKALSSKQNKPSEKPEAFMPDDLSVGDSPSTWGIINYEDLPDPADVLKHPQTVSHQTYSYQSGDVTVTCKVLYAEQFQALRRSCDCDQIMIESLARCLKWDASGGKSGSAFLKTRDDRFIAKELSRQEADSMGKFAPPYFEYMSSALSGGRPSLLAKLFGFYQISLKNPIASKSVKMNLLIMENLWYDRKFAQIYDLKGLTRNRMVQRTGRENEVLLDENLVQASLSEPYYLREHAKRILRGAIWNDTQFLADLNVMDYSMVVGVDSAKNELVLGIVDFIRTYTWDKRVENLVKETVLGGAGKGEGPTIVTPKLYKDRFRSAMEQYFPLLPDRWMKDPDSPDTQEGDKLLQRMSDW